MFKLNKKIIYCFIFILVLGISYHKVNQTNAQEEYTEKNLLMVFDASGSMTEMFGSVTRMEASKKAAADFLDGLDSNVLVGLRVFAQVRNTNKVEACKLTNLIQPFTNNLASIKSPISLLSPVGSYTPLAYTLIQAKDDFSVGKDNVLVLLTDGIDTCDGDAASAAANLFNSDKKIKVHVIGLGIDAGPKTVSV